MGKAVAARDRVHVRHIGGRRGRRTRSHHGLWHANARRAARLPLRAVFGRSARGDPASCRRRASLGNGLLPDEFPARRAFSARRARRSVRRPAQSSPTLISSAAMARRSGTFRKKKNTSRAPSQARSSSARRRCLPSASAARSWAISACAMWPQAGSARRSCRIRSFCSTAVRPNTRRSRISAASGTSRCSPAGCALSDVTAFDTGRATCSSMRPLRASQTAKSAMTRTARWRLPAA